MTDWFWFEILVGADLLPSTGFKMNFLVKWSAGGISKFIMRSLFFVKGYFPSLILVCLLLALIELVYDPLRVFLSIHVLLLQIFLFLHFYIYKMFFNSSFQISFCLSYISSCSPCYWSDKFLNYFLAECYLSSWNSNDYWWIRNYCIIYLYFFHKCFVCSPMPLFILHICLHIFSFYAQRTFRYFNLIELVLYWINILFQF